MVNSRLAAADPTLANLRALAVNLEWMNGVQFYLHRAVPSTHGHVVHIDTEWALTSISQLQFWRNVPSELFRDSDVHGILGRYFRLDGASRTDARPCSARVMRWCARRGGNSSARSMTPVTKCFATRICTRGSSTQTSRTIPHARAGCEFRAAAREPPRHLGLASRGDHRHSEPVSSVGLRSHVYRPRDDGGSHEAARRAVNGLLDAVKLMEAAVSCGRCTSPKSSRHGGCTMRRDTRPACRGTIRSYR